MLCRQVARVAGPGRRRLPHPGPHRVPSPQTLSPSPRVGLCKGGKDPEGNLPLALMPLITPVAMGRFTVLSFFTCDQVMSLRDVNDGSSGWVSCCWGRVHPATPSR